MLKAVVGFSVRQPGVVLTGATVLAVYALLRLTTAGLDIFPEFSPRLVVVQTEAPGYAAEQVEVLVTAPIERALAGLIGLDHLRSESIQGLSVVTAVFDDSTDDYRNRAQVSERLAAVRDRLPAGVPDPVPMPLASSSATVRTVGVTAGAGADPVALREAVARVLVPRVLAVTGVADVNVFGGAERALEIVPDLERLARLGIPLADVVAVARAAALRVGSGFVEGPNQRFTVTTGGGDTTPATLGAAVVTAHATGIVTLSDIADVRWGALPRISAAQIGGEPGVIVMIIGQYGANTFNVSRALGEMLFEVGPALEAAGYTLHDDLFVPSRYIERSLADISAHVAIGSAMVVVVLFLGLYNLRTALISALAIPLSMLSALLVLIAFGVNLNVMILAGLAIALGEVVDDAVIDTENIFRRLRARTEARDTPEQVVLDASLEVRSSVVFATFIVVLVFVPLLTLGGVGGRLFAPLGVAYILAVLASLVIAVTVTPALAMLLLTRTGHARPEYPLFAALGPGFEAILGGLMKRRGATVGAAVALTLGAAALVPGFGERFLPELREGHFMIHTTGLPGTSLDESIRVGTAITKAVAGIEGVRSVSQWAGRAERGADTYGSHYSEYDVALEPMSGAAQGEVLEQIFETLAQVPGVTFEANTFLVERIDETISGYSAPVVVNVYGDDLGVLDQVAARVAEIANGVPEARNVRVRSVHGRPVLDVRIDPERLARFGVAASEARDAVATLYGGTPVGEVTDDAWNYPVVVAADAARRRSPESVASVPFARAPGELVSLGDATRIELTSGRYNIVHRDAQRLQVVTMAVAGSDVSGFVERLRERVEQNLVLPDGVVLEYTGAAQAQTAARNELLADAAIAGAGVLLLVYLAVGRLRHVALILANLPFSFAGGVVAVLLTGGLLSIGSVVGFVTLFGITVRNSIMLVAHYDHLVNVDGLPWNEKTAIVGARERLPAITMTAAVTALAMVPLTIGSDNPGREIMGPMAAIIIGGLVSSTLLNLTVMPVLFSAFGRFEKS